MKRLLVLALAAGVAVTRNQSQLVQNEELSAMKRTENSDDSDFPSLAVTQPEGGVASLMHHRTKELYQVSLGHLWPPWRPLRTTSWDRSTEM